MFKKLFRKPIFVSISPNAQADDVWLALKLMFCPWKWKKGECIEIFEKMLGEYLNEGKKELDSRFRGNDKKESENDNNSSGNDSKDDSVVLFESGRTALYAILQALGIGQGDEVLIQAFTCTAAVNPIIWVGAMPIYVDIEDGTYNMSPEDLEKKITPRCKVLIIQNTFGFPGKIRELLEIAKKNNLIVLEDCAHNLGTEYEILSRETGKNFSSFSKIKYNQKIGTFGEAAFFSFGRSKVISAIFGGVAFAKNPELAEKIRKIQNQWEYPSSRWIAQQLFHPIYLAIAKLLYNFFSIGKIMIIIGKKIGLMSLMVYSIEKTGGKPPFGPAKMPNALVCLAINQFKKIEKFNQHRRELAAFYQDNLSGLEKEGILRFAQDEKNSFAVFLNFPIQVKNFGARYKLIGAAKKYGIYLESWPAKDKKVIGPDSVNQEMLFYEDGMCPNAERTAQISINLPTSPNTTKKDAERVAKFLKDFFVNCKS
jgi:dTDP-4-amino-4,6-dideoxygalactose transaminase